MFGIKEISRGFYDLDDDTWNTIGQIPEEYRNTIAIIPSQTRLFQQLTRKDVYDSRYFSLQPIKGSRLMVLTKPLVVLNMVDEPEGIIYPVEWTAVGINLNQVAHNFAFQGVYSRTRSHHAGGQDTQLEIFPKAYSLIAQYTTL